MTQENNSNNTDIIRTMVRSVYDLQQTRIQDGNRVTGNFKAKLGMKSDGMTEEQLASADKKLLEQLRTSYKRITDGIIQEGKDSVEGKLPTAKKFVGDELISSYAELILVDQYMVLLCAEEKHFTNLNKMLKGIPIYDEFLEGVTGCGTAMSAVLISEIDITKAEYPSSLHKYAGLDCVIVGKYIDESGKEFIIPAYQVEEFYKTAMSDMVMMAHGRYPVELVGVGRSRKEFCLVKKDYISKDGAAKTRDSITFNPFLKTKLIGVLGPSFLKGGKTLVEGSLMGGAKRLELASSIGFLKPSGNAEQVKNAVIDFLKFRGYNVVIENTKYGEIYYQYKFRLQNDPRHDSKSDGHRHNMAIRYAVKMFLVDYYSAARRLAGLPVSLTYAEAKLGLVHGKAGGGKPCM
jgi:hypothetical protein